MRKRFLNALRRRSIQFHGQIPDPGNPKILTADAFQFNLAHGFGAAETFLGIEDFQTG